MPRRKAPDTPTLASCWSAPTNLPIREVGRPLFCAASTYTFHAEFFETELVPRFLGLKFDEVEVERAFVVERERALGTARVVALVDADHVDPAQTTLRWDQLAVRVPGAVQHAKVTLLVWEKCVRVMVASANLTRSGYRRNREMVSVLDFHDDASSPPRALAFELLDFLAEFANWICASETAVSRLRNALQETRVRLRRWAAMPAAFKPLDRPRVIFAAALPARPGRSIRSPLDVALTMWGARRATNITVMTPFVGEAEGPTDPVVERLKEIPRARDATGYLIVPGSPSESDPNRQVVRLPRRFRETWSKAWRVKPEEVPTYVIPLTRNEEAQRDLHAKAILVSDDSVSMLLCGSSNFSPHGMGVGVSNIEANLCFFDGHEEKRDGRRLKDRLPVDWAEDFCDNAIWPDTAKPPEEELLAAGKHLPWFFRWATFDQRAAVVTIALDREAIEPATWTIRLAGTTAEISPLAAASTAKAEHRLIVERSELRGANVTALQVEWTDEEGNAWRALLSVHVDSLDSLLAPEEFRSMTMDAIIGCLLSGREPEELVEAAERSKRSKRSASELDSLRAVDTANYLLYRTRRFGRALATLGERAVRTVRSTEATRYRLRQDPLGPWALAEALVREWQGADEADRSAVVFALAELALMLAHVSRRVHDEREATDPDLRPLYKALFAELAVLRRGAINDWKPPASLAAYAEAVDLECNRLLGIRAGAPDAG